MDFCLKLELLDDPNLWRLAGREVVQWQMKRNEGLDLVLRQWLGSRVGEGLD
jgi:hypothetical protein